ncbi:hypothetical protein RCL1_001248 [Eukaryota sp. TZLM3-RCL]
MSECLNCDTYLRELEDVYTNLEAIEGRLTQSESKCDQLHSQISVTEKNFADERFSLRERISSLESEITSLRNAKDAATMAAQDANLTDQKLRVKLSQVMQELSSSQDIITELTAQRDVALSEKKKTDSLYTSLLDDHEALQQELSFVTSQINLEKGGTMELHNQIKDNINQIQKLSSTIELISHDNDKLTAQNNDLIDQISEIESQNIDLSNQLENQAKIYLQRMSELDRLIEIQKEDALITTSQIEFDRIREELSQLQESNDALVELNEQLSNQNNELEVKIEELTNIIKEGDFNQQQSNQIDVESLNQLIAQLESTLAQKDLTIEELRSESLRLARDQGATELLMAFNELKLVLEEREFEINNLRQEINELDYFIRFHKLIYDSSFYQKYVGLKKNNEMNTDDNFKPAENVKKIRSKQVGISTDQVAINWIGVQTDDVINEPIIVDKPESFSVSLQCEILPEIFEKDEPIIEVNEQFNRALQVCYHHSQVESLLYPPLEIYDFVSVLNFIKKLSISCEKTCISLLKLVEKDQKSVKKSKSSRQQEFDCLLATSERLINEKSELLDSLSNFVSNDEYSSLLSKFEDQSNLIVDLKLEISRLEEQLSVSTCQCNFLSQFVNSSDTMSLEQFFSTILLDYATLKQRLASYETSQSNLIEDQNEAQNVDDVISVLQTSSSNLSNLLFKFCDLLQLVHLSLSASSNALSHLILNKTDELAVSDSSEDESTYERTSSKALSLELLAIKQEKRLLKRQIKAMLHTIALQEQTISEAMINVDLVQALKELSVKLGEGLVTQSIADVAQSKSRDLTHDDVTELTATIISDSLIPNQNDCCSDCISLKNLLESKSNTIEKLSDLLERTRVAEKNRVALLMSEVAEMRTQLSFFESRNTLRNSVTRSVVSEASGLEQLLKDRTEELQRITSELQLIKDQNAQLKKTISKQTESLTKTQHDLYLFEMHGPDAENVRLIMSLKDQLCVREKKISELRGKLASLVMKVQKIAPMDAGSS